MKKKFISELNKHLAPLPKAERLEIIAFYEERFASGYDAGQTDDEIIASMESPEVIARNVLDEFNVSKTPAPKGASVVGLVFLNLFFSWWFIVMMSSIAASMIGAGVFSVFTTLWAFTEASTTGLVAYTAALFGVALTVTIVGFLALEGLMRFVTWLVGVHLQAFNKAMPATLETFLHRLIPSHWLNKAPRIQRLTQLVLGLGIALMVFGTGTALVFASDIEGTLDVPIEEVISAPVRQIHVRIDDGRFRIETHDKDTIEIVGQHREAQIFTQRLEGDVLFIDLENPRFTINISLPFLPGAQRPEIKVLIPESMLLDGLDVVTKNGLILVEGIEATIIVLESSNGSITLIDTRIETELKVTSSNANLTLSRVDADIITMLTSNGRIQVRDSVARTHDYRTSNGSVELTNLNHPEEGGTRLEVRSSNGSLNLSNVYVYSVRLRTSNGSINFDNADRSFFLDDVDAQTSNGSTNVNVPRR